MAKLDNNLRVFKTNFSRPKLVSLDGGGEYIPNPSPEQQGFYMEAYPSGEFDLNGRLIHEGDILTCFNFISQKDFLVCVFEDSKFVLKSQSGDKYLLKEMLKYWVVVGNCHEDVEVLLDRALGVVKKTGFI